LAKGSGDFLLIGVVAVGAWWVYNTYSTYGTGSQYQGFGSDNAPTLTTQEKATYIARMEQGGAKTKTGYGQVFTLGGGVHL
tara:strand:+ start:508 stop:750 length:243 start_codon:yes stop_codon:yes gene_type:complete